MIQRNDFIIYPRADHLIADCRVNHIGKVNRGRILRQLDNIPLRRKGIHLCAVDIQIQLNGIQIFLIIGHILLPFHNLPQPCQLCFLTFLRLARFFVRSALFIFPVGSDTVFACTVHFPCTNLHLKHLPMRANQRIVQRLIHIRLWHSNIILKPSGHGGIRRMHNPQNGIAILHAVHQRTDSEQIINLVKGFILVHHLLINAEKVLCSAVNLPLDAGLVHLRL